MTTWLCVLSHRVMVGCMGAFGPEGRVGRAIRKDLKENYLPHHCSLKDWERYCKGREDSQECFEECYE